MPQRAVDDDRGRAEVDQARHDWRIISGAIERLSARFSDRRPAPLLVGLALRMWHDMTYRAFFVAAFVRLRVVDPALAGRTIEAVQTFAGMIPEPAP
jgi:hypothetical protein